LHYTHKVHSILTAFAKINPTRVENLLLKNPRFDVEIRDYSPKFILCVLYETITKENADQFMNYILSTNSYHRNTDLLLKICFVERVDLVLPIIDELTSDDPAYYSGIVSHRSLKHDYLRLRKFVTAYKAKQLGSREG
jgi:hypothetical protein